MRKRTSVVRNHSAGVRYDDDIVASEERTNVINTSLRETCAELGQNMINVIAGDAATIHITTCIAITRVSLTARGLSDQPLGFVATRHSTQVSYAGFHVGKAASSISFLLTSPGMASSS